MTRFLILLLMIFAVSCRDKKEEVCMPPSVVRHLPGEWGAKGTLMGEPVLVNKLVFLESGDLVGSEKIFENTFEDVRHVTWRAERQNVFLSLEYGSGSTVEFVLPVLDNQCGKMVIGEEGVLYLELLRTVVSSF
jgi:hypothetical protein